MEIAQAHSASPILNVSDWSGCSVGSLGSSKPAVHIVMSSRRSTASATAEPIDFHSRTYITREPGWKELYLSAAESVHQGQFDTALKLLLQALDKLRFAPDADPRLEETLDRLIQISLKMNNLPEAEKYCLRALEVKQRIYPRLNSRVAACLNRLGGIYYRLENFDKVESLCLESERIFVQLQGHNCENVATVAANLAHLYRVQGKYGAARSRYFQALKIKTAIQQQGDSEWAVVYCGFGDLLSMAGFN